MTALKPGESRLVRGVSATRYPLNATCASPVSDADTKADDAHHCWPRSAIGNDSWFIEFYDEDGLATGEPIPHVVGLSREQHERVERHEAWIKLEDGVWNWYECCAPSEEEKDRWEEETGQHRDDYPVDSWEFVGPLNPQPGSREGKPKRRKLKDEARRKRKVISIRVPDDEENGGAIWDETLGEVKDRLVTLGLYENAEKIPVYEATIAVWRDWLNG